jgi:hypothetical protein
VVVVGVSCAAKTNKITTFYGRGKWGNARRGRKHFLRKFFYDSKMKKSEKIERRDGFSKKIVVYVR